MVRDFGIRTSTRIGWPSTTLYVCVEMLKAENLSTKETDWLGLSLIVEPIVMYRVGLGG